VIEDDADSKHDRIPDIVEVPVISSNDVSERKRGSMQICKFNLCRLEFGFLDSFFSSRFVIDDITHYIVLVCTITYPERRKARTSFRGAVHV